jgi:hypothetical protein
MTAQYFGCANDQLGGRQQAQAGRFQGFERAADFQP